MCIYRYVCIYLCMYVCMHVFMYLCIYVCMCVCMHGCMYVCMRVCMFMLTARLPSSEMQRFCVSRDQSCLVTVHVTLHMKLVGWGGVGHVNVRWTLRMTLLLRDEPSLQLAHDVDATR